MKIDDHPVVPPVKLRTHIVTNCVLSKSEYPNIDKYFKNYEEHEVITEIPEEERKRETTPSISSDCVKLTVVANKVESEIKKFAEEEFGGAVRKGRKQASLNNF